MNILNLFKSSGNTRMVALLLLLALGALIAFQVFPESTAHAKGSGCRQGIPAPELKNRFKMTKEEFELAAEIEFNRCHRKISKLESAPSKFQPNIDFPTTAPVFRELPWKHINPIETPKEYMDTLLKYAMDQCGTDHVDWDGNLCGWYHAPWMHDLREPMRGLTKERSSRRGELHPSQTSKSGNWAVSLYNNIGGHGFHKIWGTNSAYPKTKGFAFDEGTVAIKLLFSLATPEEVPYLRYAKTWEIHDGEKIVTVRLIQVDILVKDDQVKDDKNPDPNRDLTGWVMGSYLFNGSIETMPRCDSLRQEVEACEQARWQERLIPIGLQWGNDPQIYAGADPTYKEETPEPVQHWLNDDVSTMFANVRTMSGHPSYLGRDGRMNGPVDNHRSTCLACHGRALDFGEFEEDQLRYVPFVAADDASNEELRARFFRNLNSDEAFVEGTQTLDYSLQAAVGLHHFREWVEAQVIDRDLKNETRDFTPGYMLPDAIDGELKIATWNIANLHHETNTSLRNGAEKRSEKDYERLRGIAKDLNADIIGLQEIGSLTALKRVFPEDKYHLIMSDRYTLGDEYRSMEKRDIYNAMAFSKQKFPKAPTVTTLDAFSLVHLEYDAGYDIAQYRPNRAAMSVEFEHNGQMVSLLNLHLKSGCNDYPIDPVADQNGEGESYRSRFACRTLVAQRAILENWIELQQGLGHSVIAVGDFNRQLNFFRNGKGDDANKYDDFWVRLNDGTPNKLTLVKGPKDPNLVCWPNVKNNESHIDFIVADDGILSDGQSSNIKKIGLGFDDEDEYPEYKGDGRKKLSDHCPVLLTLTD